VCTCANLFTVCPQDLACSNTEVRKLTAEIEQLRSEKTDLLEEVEAHKLMVRSSHVTFN